MSYRTRKRMAASERGKRMAARRWELDAERRAAINAMNPIKFSGRIIRRVVVIDHEKTAREAVIYDFDSRRSAAAKLRRILLIPNQANDQCQQTTNQRQRSRRD